MEGQTMPKWSKAITLSLIWALSPAGVGGQLPFQGNDRVPWIPVEDRTGFSSMFDGKTLAGWDGNPDQWRVENGVIVGESTAEFPVDSGNTFLIWKGGTPADFELKLEFRFATRTGNSGVQYRSRLMQNGRNRWAITGYQADMDFANQFTGQVTEEAGRRRLAALGMVSVIDPEGNKGLVGAIASTEELGAGINPTAWNTLHIIAVGRTLVHIVNGQVTAVVVDHDSSASARDGLIALQLHGGPPMRVEFRNIAIKMLPTG